MKMICLNSLVFYYVRIYVNIGFLIFKYSIRMWIVMGKVK